MRGLRLQPILGAAVAVLLAVAPFAGAAHAAQGESRVTLADQATVTGRTIRLGELGDLEGDALAFADLDLGPAPEPGATRRRQTFRAGSTWTKSGEYAGWIGRCTVSGGG